MTRWPAVELVLETQDAPAHLWVDPDQLVAALWAVLQNAAEAVLDTREAKVLLSFRAQVGRTRIGVVDNGAGIAPADATDIFRPFFTTKREGTGVGLSLARQILRGHDGDLALASLHPGRTEFEASIPA